MKTRETTDRFLILIFCIMMTASPALAAKGEACNLETLKKTPFTIFLNPKNKSKWFSATPDSAALFTHLGFKPLKEKNLKGLRLVNLKPCPAQFNFNKMYESTDKSFVVTALNACQEDKAKALGLVPAKTIENYGSMESPSAYNWSLINICKDEPAK